MLEKNKCVELASKLLQISVEEVSQCSGIIEEHNLFYVSIPTKGGSSLIIDENNEVLYADSSIGYTKHLEEYLKGTRTPMELF